MVQVIFGVHTHTLLGYTVISHAKTTGQYSAGSLVSVSFTFLFSKEDIFCCIVAWSILVLYLCNKYEVLTLLKQLSFLFTFPG